MQITKALLALVLTAAPVFAAPVEELSSSTNEAEALSQAQASFVTCKPAHIDQAAKTKTFKINQDEAKAQIKEIGINAGASGDPHQYSNGDGITWPVATCNRKHQLYEYPVYWVNGPQKKWDKNKKASQQAKTPVRFVYANAGGSFIFCGVMVHDYVSKDLQGMKPPKGKTDFVICK